jgi:aspartyl-tRNA(Asn)/glutamyl-tRNA(Gln) amidotransferase subunit B
MKSPYEAVIGLEVHAQLLTGSKIFCGCSTSFGAPPNTHTCPVCAGLPGVLPVFNRKVAEFAIRAAAATGCRIPEVSYFARKNYFYPDLPKGYQISQYENPLAVGGSLKIETDEGTKSIGLTRIHLEEDAGKLIHGEALGDAEASFVDLNRTGVPLMEIVTEPEISSPQEARACLTALRDLLLHLEVCDGNMEEGSLRCDANVSVRRIGEALGTKTEVKNMNSFRHVERALAYEIERQMDLLDSGEKVIQETRLWDEEQEITLPMRGKEEAHDYRYFPEPDLVPLVIGKDWIEKVVKELPELPLARKNRFVEDYGLPAYDAGILIQTPQMASFFEETVMLFPQPKAVSNWIMGELLRLLKEDKKEIQESSVTPDHLSQLLKLVEEGTLSGKMAKEVFEEMYRKGEPPGKIVKDRGMTQIADPGLIEELVEQVLQEHPGEVEDYRGGKEKLLAFFVGQVMKASRGKANPGLVNELLKKKLSR